MSDGYATDPEKFEGQALWVPPAYESTLDGCWDRYGIREGDSYHYSLAVVDDKMKNWSLDPDTYAVCITVDSYGLVYGSELTREQYEDFMRKEERYKMRFLTEMLVGEYGEVTNEQFFHDIVNNAVVPMMNKKVNFLEQTYQLSTEQSNSIREDIANFDCNFPYGYVSCYPKHFFDTIVDEMRKIEEKIEFK